MNAVVSVYELTEEIKRLINISFPYQVSVEGEISNFNKYASGHCYFKLKDAQAQLKCVMFATYANQLITIPQDGDKVILTGKLDVYHRDGVYQLMVSKLSFSGIGDIYKRYEQLKKKLESEGLFDTKRKLPLPKYPSKVGILASIDGAALHDFIVTCERRYKPLEIYIFPCLVQRATAPKSVIDAIKKALNYPLDVIVIARGGGSFEDLNAFNDEELVRLVSTLHIPTVSAIGHETDYTILDFVASRRAATPTAAAEIVTQYCYDLPQLLDSYADKLSSLITTRITKLENKYQAIASSYGLKSLNNIIENRRLLLKQISSNIDHHLAFKFNNYQKNLDSYHRLLTPSKLIDIVTNKKTNLNTITNNLNTSLSMKIKDYSKTIANYNRIITPSNISTHIERKKTVLLSLSKRLDILDITATLRRGFALVKNDKGLIKSVTEATKEMTVKFIDGEIDIIKK